MQTIPASNQFQQGSSPSSNPLKQLFSSQLSPRQKVADPTPQKPSLSCVELGNKYRYSLQDMIGDGYTSRVYKGYQISRPGKCYAIKVIQKRKLDKDQIKLIKNEIELHPQLEHRNVVKCYDVYDTAKMIYVVMEWCQSGDLEKYITDFREKAIPELKAIELMEQVIQGYRYLVEQGILHRDLKPANILRAGSTLKIADFGFAVKGRKTLIDSMSVGTPLYMPPQSIQQCVYSHKSDFFSLGCIMYQLLHGQTPWYKIDEKALAKCMKSSQINLSQIRNDKIKYFISKTCEISQGHRMSVDEFMSFDFRKPLGISLELNILGLPTTETVKFKMLPRHQTDRHNFNACILQQNPAAKRSIKLRKSQTMTLTSSKKSQTLMQTKKSQTLMQTKKSQTLMQATFASSLIYFRNAKCEQTKKVTTDFEDKFQFCLLLKYLIENSGEFLLVEEFDKKNLKIVMFRHCIFVLKRLLLDFVRTRQLGVQAWMQYKETGEFKLFEEECKGMKERMQKEFNLQLRGMSLKNLSEVNKRFPQLSQQYELSKSFYQKLKQFLRQIIRQLNTQISKKLMQKLSFFSYSSQQPTTCQLSPYFETFKSLIRYYQNCEQRQILQDISKSPAYNLTKSPAYNLTIVKSSTTIDTNTPTSSRNHSGLLTPAKKNCFNSTMGEFNFLGKNTIDSSGGINHLSPDNGKTLLMSPRIKYTTNKTTSKKLTPYQTQLTSPQFFSNQRNHPIKSNFFILQPELTNKLSQLNDTKSPKKILLLQKSPSKTQSVESFFSVVLCRKYEESKMTKEQFIALKKKINWLW